MRTALSLIAPALALTTVLLGASPCAAQAQPRLPPPAHQERGNLVLEGIPAAEPALAERVERYLHARQATFLDWLPDGAMLITTRFGEVDEVHRIAAALAAREQLTFYKEPVSVARAAQAAGTEGFAFLKDEGGDENAQVYYYELADHGARALTSGKSVHGSLTWSHDGKRLAFYGNDRDGTNFDVYVADIAAGGAPRLLVGPHGETWYPLDWSVDDHKLLLWKYFSVSESYLYLADAATGEITPLEKSNRKVGIRAARFAPDGRGVYVVSDEDGEFAQLRYVDLVTHDARRLTANIPWDIEAFDASSDGRYLAYVANVDGVSRLTIIDNTQKLTLTPPGILEGHLAGLRFDRAGHRLAFSAENAQTPRDVYVYDLQKNALETLDAQRGGVISAYVYRPHTPGR